MPTPDSDWPAPAPRSWRLMQPEKRSPFPPIFARCWDAPVIVRFAALAVLLAACASAPRAGPLTGVPVATGIPDTRLRHGYRRLIFSWEAKERVFSARGEGSARIAPPDSLRIDLFLENGSSGGYAILLGDSLVALAQDEARRSLPPE